ncbi:hypothetical protein HBB16_09080 [Pseudonocardia sp. MCCB 268]|nr:hypothetical protein [Pseudonocardia cytotoxica]
MQPHGGSSANAVAFSADGTRGHLPGAQPRPRRAPHPRRASTSPACTTTSCVRDRRETGDRHVDEVARLAEHRPTILAGWSDLPAPDRLRPVPGSRRLGRRPAPSSTWPTSRAHWPRRAPQPVPYADVVTTTIHKTLGGPAAA